MRNRHLLGLALTLCAAGLALFMYKAIVLGFPVVADRVTDTWTVEAAVSFDGGPGSQRVNLYVPTLMPGYAVLEENFISRGFGITTQLGAGGRQAEWAVRQAPGRQTLYYRAVVYPDPGARGEDTTPDFPVAPRLGEPYDTALRVLLDEVRAQSADSATLAATLIRRINDPSPDQNVELLRSRADSPIELARELTVFLAGERIAARVVRGVLLQDQVREARVLPWLEVYDGREWVFFDPQTGRRGLPPNFLAWWRGTSPMVQLEGGSNPSVQVSIRRNTADAIRIAEARSEERAPRLLEFSPLSLPIQTQALYSVLLMIPVGALIIVLMRNVVGFKTFGTFMPVLIALAFRETQLLGGLLMFTLLVGLGLAVRFYLERLRLLLVPRLAVVLSVVVVLMLLISILSHRLGVDAGLSIALFPMVILAMTIERMCIVWEERGPSEALQQGLGSMAVAALAYMVMGLDVLRHLVFVFPELLLVVLAATLLLGRYTGYRLLELWRFRALAEERR